VSEACLLDFGIARPLDADTLTGRGALVGTPGYMAPERVRGEETVDPASDIFSLGCVLFECLLGRLDDLMCGYGVFRVNGECVPGVDAVSWIHTFTHQRIVALADGDETSSGFVCDQPVFKVVPWTADRAKDARYVTVERLYNSSTGSHVLSPSSRAPRS